MSTGKSLLVLPETELKSNLNSDADGNDILVSPEVVDTFTLLLKLLYSASISPDTDLKSKLPLKLFMQALPEVVVMANSFVFTEVAAISPDTDLKSKSPLRFFILASPEVVVMVNSFALKEVASKSPDTELNLILSKLKLSIVKSPDVVFMSVLPVYVLGI